MCLELAEKIGFDWFQSNIFFKTFGTWTWHGKYLDIRLTFWILNADLKWRLSTTADDCIILKTDPDGYQEYPIRHSGGLAARWLYISGGLAWGPGQSCVGRTLGRTFAHPDTIMTMYTEDTASWRDSVMKWEYFYFDCLGIKKTNKVDIYFVLIFLCLKIDKNWNNFRWLSARQCRCLRCKHIQKMRRIWRGGGTLRGPKWGGKT